MFPKDLKSLTKEEFSSFFDSFDTILSDIDGVIRHFNVAIEGAKETLFALKQHGKRIHFITNNSFQQPKALLPFLNGANVEFGEEDIATPSMALISYLKRVNFNRKIFVIGTEELEAQFRDAGLSVYERSSLQIPHLIEDLRTGKVVEDIGALIIDIDFDLNFAQLTKALSCLNSDNVLYVAGACDNFLPLSKTATLIGPGLVHDMLYKMTGKLPTDFGKPSPNFREFVFKKFNITDPSRVLLIGDSLAQDITFGVNCGFQTLLVLSGLSTLEDLEVAEQSSIPKYFVEGLLDLYDLLKLVETR